MKTEIKYCEIYQHAGNVQREQFCACVLKYHFKAYFSLLTVLLQYDSDGASSGHTSSRVFGSGVSELAATVVRTAIENVPVGMTV